MSRFPGGIIEGLQHGPAVGAAGDGLDGLYKALLHTAPSGGSCTVVIEGLDPAHAVLCYCPSSTTGTVGNLVLVAFDDEKSCWLVVNLGRSAL